MSDQNQKAIYVGSGVEKFDGDLIEISVCLSDLPAEHRFEYNGKWYAKLKVKRKKETDEYGKTHSVSINTWKPEASKTNQTTPEPSTQTEEVDLPF
tara:strand:- start:4633 stop:4920 length:288 start_codon:yes stop_codon:yes gene_type:complete